MAGYISATEMNPFLPGGVTITGSSSPIAIGDVASYIGEISAELDGIAAAKGYQVPLSPTTATTAYAQMQLAAKNGVGAWIMQTLFPNLGGPADKTSLAAEYRQAYKDFRDALRTGELTLVGAAADRGSSGRALPRSFSSSHPVADNSGASSMVPINWQP